MEERFPSAALRSSPLSSAASYSAQVRPGVDGAAAEDSDEELMAAYARGASGAFGQLYARYKQPIFGFFRRRVLDEAQAEELAQECFLAVIRGAARYEPEALFRTYLYAIALKMVRAHRRKALFRGMFFGVAESRHEPAEANHLDAEIALRQAVGRLDRTDREVLMLREYEELSYAEIAELLGLPLNTVRSRLFRARMALREMLSAPVAETLGTRLTHSEERI